MRKLHAVSPNELFVASGEYRYWRDGTQLPMIEKFTIHEVGDGAFLYRVDEDGRDADGLTILSEALISPDKQFERFNVQSYNPKDDLLKAFKADYTFNPEYVQIGRRLDKNEREYDEFPLIENCEIYIKQTLYMGLTIQHILAGKGKSQVFAPQLLSDEENLLQKIIVEERGTESLQIGRKTLETRKYQIADDVFYWLDEHDIPLQREYTHDGIKYQVRVANYAYR
ncbi:MAG: hypothetical protein Phog2KO_04760 [Phototrophicaceae bacterium]